MRAGQNAKGRSEGVQPERGHCLKTDGACHCCQADVHKNEVKGAHQDDITPDDRRLTGEKEALVRFQG